MSEAFDYSVAAELYLGGPKSSRQRSRYMRFPSIAEAIRYAIEELSGDTVRTIILEAGDTRYDVKAVRALYEASGYPLRRGPP